MKMTQHIRQTLFVVTILSVCFFSACDSDDPQDSGCELLEFGFLKSDNSKLLHDCTGEINGNVVTVQMPADTDLTSLVAQFKISGEEAYVNNIVQISGQTANDFTDAVIYVVIAEDNSKRQYSVRINEISPRISSFRINRSTNQGLQKDVVFKIDQEQKTITGVITDWIASDTPDRLVASFTTSSDTEMFIENIPQETGITRNSFSNEMTYTVKHTKMDVQTDYKVTLICPQVNASLPIMRFSIDLNQITSKEDYKKTKLEIIGNGINEGLWSYSDPEVEIRLRGNSTMWLPKRPFRVKFPDKISPLGLNHATEKNWVLLANDADKTLLRNAVAFSISRTLLQNDNPANYHDPNAILFTPATLHVDVYVGDKYQGVYHLTDQVQRNPGRVDLKKPGTDPNDADITGGYLLEIDGFADGEFSWFATTRGMKITLKYPDMEDDYKSSGEAWNDSRFQYIRKVVQDAEKGLFSDDFKDPDNGWRQYFDESTLIDYYIISEFSGNSDAWWSTYIYKLRDKDSHRLFFGPVWDFDIAFNNDNRIHNAVNSLMMNAGHDFRTWVQRFFQDEGLKSAVKSRWNQMKGQLLGNALNTVENDAERMYWSRLANFEVWNITKQNLGHANSGPVNYETGINQLKNYINQRYAYLDGVFAGW